MKRLEWGSFTPVPWVQVLNDPRQLGCRFGPTGLLGTKDPGEGTGEEGGREGQARVVQGSGAKAPFLNPREGRQRAHKGTLLWTIYPAFTSDSEVSDNGADPPTPHLQAALRAKTSWDPGQWTGLQGEAHPGLYRGQCCQHLQSIWWGGGLIISNNHRSSS